MALSESFLRAETEKTENCLLGDKKVQPRQRFSTILEKGRSKFIETAKKWPEVEIHFSDPLYHFRHVYLKVDGLPSAIFCHETCRLNFGTRYKRYVEKYGLSKTEIEDNSSPANSKESSGDICSFTRSPTAYLEKKRLCFVCNFQRSSESNQYKQGGLGLGSTLNSATRLREALDRQIAGVQNCYFQAAQRLKLLQCSQSHDIFAIDVYYHQSCYLKFIKTEKDTTDDNKKIQEDMQAMVLAEFDITIKVKILGKKCAYLSSCLLKDIKNMGLSP